MNDRSVVGCFLDLIDGAFLTIAAGRMANAWHRADPWQLAARQEAVFVLQEQEYY